VGSISGVNRSGREFNHSPPYSAEVESEWIHICVLFLCLQGVDREDYLLYGWVFSSSATVRHIWSLTARGVEEVRVFVCLVVYGRTVLVLDRFFVQQGEGKETCSIALREGM